MYDEFMRIPTSYDVWAAIRHQHPNMPVFGSYSAPMGDHGGDRGVMFTSYGFEGADLPTMCAETTWDIDRENTSNRINEQHKYWLYVSTEKENS